MTLLRNSFSPGRSASEPSEGIRREGRAFFENLALIEVARTPLGDSACRSRVIGFGVRSSRTRMKERKLTLAPLFLDLPWSFRRPVLYERTMRGLIRKPGIQK